MELIGFGMTCALATLLTCCLVISLTYTEFFWWFLALPICFQRAVYNYQEDLATAPALERERQFSVSTHLSGRPPGMARLAAAMQQQRDRRSLARRRVAARREAMARRAAIFVAMGARALRPVLAHGLSSRKASTADL